MPDTNYYFLKDPVKTMRFKLTIKFVAWKKYVSDDIQLPVNL